MFRSVRREDLFGSIVGSLLGQGNGEQDGTFSGAGSSQTAISCSDPRYRSVVWMELCPSRNLICSRPPPLFRHSFAQVRLRSWAPRLEIPICLADCSTTDHTAQSLRPLPAQQAQRPARGRPGQPASRSAPADGPTCRPRCGPLQPDHLAPFYRSGEPGTSSRAFLQD
jgi:hypothetical protein